MKKALKITGIGLIIFVLVANLHSAIFTFYGVKTNNLSGVVWATALSSTDGTSGDGGESGTSSWWDSPVYSTVHCGTIYYSGSETNHVAGQVSYTTNAAGVVSINVSFGTGGGTSYTGTIAPHDAQMKQCIGPNYSICGNITAVEACK